MEDVVGPERVALRAYRQPASRRQRSRQATRSAPYTALGETTYKAWHISTTLADYR